MAPVEPVLLARTHDLPTPALADWAALLGARLAAGERLLTLYGRPEGDADLITTAVLQTVDGRLQVQRGRGPRGAGFPSLTVQHPAAQMFERELWEQTGLVSQGHPWLKPVRYQGARQQQMAGHPFFSVRGQEVHEVGVGPVHASVIEPGHFRFMCHGERVQHLEIQLGWQHRGIEAQLLQRAPQRQLSTIECVAGDSSIAYAVAWCAALEALAGAPVSPVAECVRGIALELERVAMHLVALGGLATDIAFLQGGATYGRLRTAIINATMRVCGSRFGRGWVRPGGVRFGIDRLQRQDLLDTLAAFAKDLAEVNDLVCSARSVQARLQGVGTVSRQAATELGLVGLAARASGVAVDARCSLPGRLYQAHPAALLTEAGGDCWARMRLRMREIGESLRWLNVALAANGNGNGNGDGGAGTLPAQAGPLAPDSLCISVCEGFRGPVLQALETGPDGQLLHVKLQDPSLLNWFGLAISLRNNEISDFPLCNKSFDLSYCGNDL